MEGAPPSAFLGDGRHDSIQIAEHLCGRNPQCRESRLGDRSVAYGVAHRPITSLVRIGIDLDRQSGLEAGEVERERIQRKLTSESEAIRPSAKHRPQPHLRRAHLAPQLTRAPYRFDPCVQDARAPSTRLRLVPLPVPGRKCRHWPRLRMRAVRSMVQTSSSRWLNMRCSKVTRPASGRDLDSRSAITSVSARRVSPTKTGLGMRTLS